MTRSFDVNRQVFPRLKDDIPIRYKLLSKDLEVPDRIFEGASTAMAENGLLLVGKIPPTIRFEDLLRGRVLLGMNILLPSASDPIKVLGRVTWIEAMGETTSSWGLGMTYKEIDPNDRRIIARYLIKSQIL